MSASPPKDLDAEVGVQSSDDMERDQAESSQQASGFDFEVKEQDRWLPIANGVLLFCFPLLLATCTLRYLALFKQFQLEIVHNALTQSDISFGRGSLFIENRANWSALYSSRPDYEDSTT